MFDKESLLKTLESENRTQIVIYHHEGGLRLAKFIPGKGLTEVGNFDSRFWGYKFKPARISARLESGQYELSL
jgi:hypothetical protein